MPGKLAQADKIELVFSGKNVKYQTRKDVGSDFLHKRYLLYEAKSKLATLKFLNIGVLGAGFFMSPVFLLALVLTLPQMFQAQFYYANLWDENDTWENHYVARIDGKF